MSKLPTDTIDEGDVQWDSIDGAVRPVSMRLPRAANSSQALFGVGLAFSLILAVFALQ